MNQTKLILVLFLAVYTTTWAQDTDSVATGENEVSDTSLEARKARLLEEIKKRRAIQKAIYGDSTKTAPKSSEFNPTQNGAVYQAGESKGDKIASLVIHNLSVGSAGRNYAMIKGKEVMISSKVSSSKINIRLKNVTRAEAIEAFEKEFSTIGIQIVEVGNDIVVLTNEN